MGGAGSGRKRTVTTTDQVANAESRKETVSPTVRVSHAERRQRRYQIAVYAATHGVRAAMAEFNVRENLVRKSLWANKMYPAREMPPKVGVSSIRILKRMLVDRESAAVAAVTVGVTANYANAVWREAVAAGFIFQERQCEDGHGNDAEEPDGGERGEGLTVG